MNKLLKNLTREDWHRAAHTDNEQREQLLEEVTGDLKIGRYSVMIRSERIDEYLPELKERFADIPNITLKIFLEPMESKPPAQVKWGVANHSIYDATIIQNMFAFEKLAPRVYDFLIVGDDNREFIAQITEDVGDPDRDEDFTRRFFDEKIMPKVQQWQLGITQRDINPTNVIRNKWVDFQGFYFIDKTARANKIKSIHEEAQTWQKNIYQTLDELGIKGVRNDDRVQLFDEFIWEDAMKGKSVLDVGCSGGRICNLASYNGAKRVVGVDMPAIASAAQLSSNHLGYFNIDYYGYNLVEEDFYEFIQEKGFKTFDTIIFFSMIQHVHFPEYLHKLMHKDSVLLFEGNPTEPVVYIRPKYEEIFKKHFSRVSYIGDSKDWGARPLYKLQK